MSQILENLPEKNDSRGIQLKKLSWHGLTEDEPLVLEEVIKSCFENPKRAKYPQFFDNKNLGTGRTLCTISADPQYWISLVDQKLVKQFNGCKIRLHDTSQLRGISSGWEHVAKDDFLSEITNSRWAGPYISEERGLVYFVTNAQGAHCCYFVQLVLDILNHTRLQKLSLHFNLNSSEIALPLELNGFNLL